MILSWRCYGCERWDGAMEPMMDADLGLVWSVMWTSVLVLAAVGAITAVLDVAEPWDDGRVDLQCHRGYWRCWWCWVGELQRPAIGWPSLPWLRVSFVWGYIRRFHMIQHHKLGILFTIKYAIKWQFSTLWANVLLLQGMFFVLPILLLPLWFFPSTTWAINIGS